MLNVYRGLDEDKENMKRSAYLATPRGTSQQTKRIFSCSKPKQAISQRAIKHEVRLENFFELGMSWIAIVTSLLEIAPTPSFIEFALDDQVKVFFQTIFYSENLTNMCLFLLLAMTLSQNLIQLARLLTRGIVSTKLTTK